MAPKYPDEVNVFAVPHSRMKSLVRVYMDQLSSVNFQSNGALQILLQSLVESFCEFKTHEYIENRFIMERLKQRLKVMNVSSRAVCNCHNDDRLPELLKLLRQGYTCTDKSLSERASFGIQLEKAVKDFTDMFLPHMQEEEDVFQPLLVRYFGYEELRLLKNIVIEQHELWKEKLAAAKQSTDNLFEFLSSFVENKDQLQTIVEITCENLMNETQRSCRFNDLPQEMMTHIFSYLNLADRVRCSRVCKLWNMSIYSGDLWKRVFPTNWAKGFLDFEYRDPYSQVDERTIKYSQQHSDDDDQVVPDEAQKEAHFYRQFLVHVLPRIGDRVQQLVLAGGLHLSSQVLRSMLILCPNVQHLDVSYTNITDIAFKGLAKHGACSQLSYVDLSGCSRLTDVAMQRLGDCFVPDNQPPSSRCCKCQRCAVEQVEREPSDAGVGQWACSDGLSHLNLSGCSQISDYGLESLLDVTLNRNSLRSLDVSGCFRISGSTLMYITSRSSRLEPQNLYYCNKIEEGPYLTEANGCQNLDCPVRSCCCCWTQ